MAASCHGLGQVHTSLLMYSVDDHSLILYFETTHLFHLFSAPITLKMMAYLPTKMISKMSSPSFAGMSASFQSSLSSQMIAEICA